MTVYLAYFQGGFGYASKSFLGFGVQFRILQPETVDVADDD